MQVKDLMTPDPTCSTPDTTLQRVAEMMVEHDCGEIPVVDNVASMLPVGVIRSFTCMVLLLLNFEAGAYLYYCSQRGHAFPCPRSKRIKSDGPRCRT